MLPLSFRAERTGPIQLSIQRRACPHPVGLYKNWLGCLIVSTRFFSEAAHQELIDDYYPIALIHGKWLAEQITKISHEEDRYAKLV
jgi:hypothetical protein